MLSFLSYSSFAQRNLNYAKINCGVRYLKSVNKLESTYPTYKTNETEDCQTFLYQFLRDTYNDVSFFFEKSSNQINCVIDKLQDNNMADYSLKREILVHAKWMPRRDRLLKINGVSFQINTFLTGAVNICMQESGLNEYS